MTEIVYSIGHSTHTTDRFVILLRRHGIEYVVDVRSAPFSRHNPQFNKDALQKDLKKSGIGYLFLGKNLGARSDDPTHYQSGRVDYDKLAGSAIFQEGLERVVKGASGGHRLALMCAEKEPLDCHRTILVSRHLEKAGVQVRHILASGEIEDHSATMKRLASTLSLPLNDLFRNDEEVIDDAYKKREEMIAYRIPEET